MADDIQTTPGTASDPRVATNDKGGRHVQIVQLDLGNDTTIAEVTGGQKTAAGSLPVVLASDQPAVPVSDGGGSLTVDGTVAVSGTVAVGDGGGSLTVDGAITANAGTGPWPVTDNGGSLTIDGTVNAAQSGTWNVTVDAALPAGSNNIGDVDIASAIPAGTNNIGDVDIASIAAGDNNIGNVDVVTQPTRAATTDTITAKLATDAIQNGTTALTPKFAKANVAASSTDSNIVSAVASKKIRVLAARIHAGGTVTNVTFNSKPAGAGTAISELFACAANGGHHLAFAPVGHFETVAGEGLTVTTGAGATVGIGVVYVEV